MTRFFPIPRAITAVPAFVLLAILLAPGAIRAQTDAASSPVGRWKTIDDHTGKPKSIVEIREQNGTLTGTIETLLNPPTPHPTCNLCSGAKKDQPFLGLEILWGFHLDGGQWSGGQVLDPETGKVYSATITLQDGGNKLRLRGYIGISLLGRTQYWLREH
ncbi:MAG: DUF2147 domain-containing protein [Terracidiphilus sp.]|jgi:uncharacterized protein (DUF2147 family)